MIKFFLLIILFVLAGCDSEEVKLQYQNHPFDQKVIDKLPIYDSLSSLLIRNFPFYQKEIQENNAFKVVFTGIAPN